MTNADIKTGFYWMQHDSISDPPPFARAHDPKVFRGFFKRYFQNGGKGIFLDQNGGKNVILDKFWHLKKCKKEP